MSSINEINNTIAVEETVSPVAASTSSPSKPAKRALKKNVAPSEFNGPQRPKSGYMLFGDSKRAGVMVEIRKEAEAAGVSFKVVEVGKKISALWKAASEEEKKSFNDKAAELRVAYAEEDKAWKESDSYKAFLKEKAGHQKKRAEGKAKEEVRSAGMPKKAMTSWMYFEIELNLFSHYRL